MGQTKSKLPGIIMIDPYDCYFRNLFLEKDGKFVDPITPVIATHSRIEHRYARIFGTHLPQNGSVVNFTFPDGKVISVLARSMKQKCNAKHRKWTLEMRVPQPHRLLKESIEVGVSLHEHPDVTIKYKYVLLL
jgi:hypothetical protein